MPKTPKTPPLPDDLRDLARARTPAVPTVVMPGTDRLAVIDALPATDNIGIELGVAAGSFSARLVQSGRFRHVFGVDVYADSHTVREYKTALRATGLFSSYRLLRMTFDEALDLFEDASLDFIYADGYAHTGEDGGRTLVDWYAKLKPGGIFAGDDYDPVKWPLVVWAVNHLADQIGATLSVTDTVAEASYNRYRSWCLTKPADGPAPQVCADLAGIGAAERARIAEIGRRTRQARRRAARKARA